MESKDEVALEQPRSDAIPGTALVVQTDITNDRYMLRAGNHLRLAARARSCLVQPRVGDVVGCMEMDEGGFYITAVLDRPGGEPLTLQLPPGTVIQCEAGALELRADTLALHARALSVQGDQAHLSVEQVVGVGQRASWSFGVLKLTAELVESFAERLLQFSRWSQRVVDGPDQVRARQMDYRADQIMQLQAQTLIANADTLFKADGQQIHIG
ncbi:DUF3540 domain-containing protein [Ottowia pentelensis]|uniref:DUF3540 domain-containing protein n=1 Tax=Ottowia pentelensis TaxID=511108 RepID=A0ABV6PN09_9BURK